MISVISKHYVKRLLRCRSMTERVPWKRNSSLDAWVYRGTPKPCPKWDSVTAEVLGGFLWWWIFVHMWYDFDHLVGEFPYPDPTKWSDDDLGVPPLD